MKHLYDKILADIVDEFKDIAHERIQLEKRNLDPDEFSNEYDLLELRFTGLVNVLEALFFGHADKIKARYDAALARFLDHEIARKFKISKGSWVIADYIATGPLAEQTIASKMLQAVQARHQRLLSH